MSVENGSNSQQAQRIETAAQQATVDNSDVPIITWDMLKRYVGDDPELQQIADSVIAQHLQTRAKGN